MKNDDLYIANGTKLMRAPLFLLFLVFLSIVSCNSEKANTEMHEDHISETELPVLINGEKWKANEEMNDVIVKAEQEAKQFNGNELTGYQSLGKKLKSMVKEITNSCTMQGRAHEELHKWLVLHIKYINRLSESEDIRSASENYKNVLNNFEDYHRYFE